MFKHSEYNLLETKKFIELTKSAMLNTEDFEKWNSIKAMFGIYTERNRGTYMLRPVLVQKYFLCNLRLD